MAEWELSKENIQPLRQGRKLSALQDQVDSRKIAEEKQAYELALRTYDGDDPLKPWIEYIIWVEQTFPKAGKDGNLNALLEKCIKQFKGTEKYDQDPRFLSVWMKYAHLSANPLEVYNYMHSVEVCDRLAKFYIEWAWELEQVNNFKRAEQIFAIAEDKISSDSEERETLELKHKQFQARVMKKMLEKPDDSEDQPVHVEEQRTVLSSLKGFGKKHQVGSIRVGAAKIADGPGALVTSGQLPRSTSSKTQFQIYSSHEENGPKPTSKSSSSSLPGSKESNQENEIDPGKWTQNRIGKKAYAVPLDQISIKPSFAIHQDDDIVTPSKSGANAGVLASHKPKKDEDDEDFAVALFEPPDPTKKPMYCKHLVYQGVTEFSLEELRAARYLQRDKNPEAEMKNQEKKEDDEDVPIPVALFEPPDPMKKPMYAKHMVYQGPTEYSFEELRAVRYRHREAISEAEKFEREMTARREALMLQEQKMREMQLEMEKKLVEFQLQQENAMMKQQLIEENLRKQQEDIENLKRQKISAAAEFTIPTKPIREKLLQPLAVVSEAGKGLGFKIYSDNANDKSSTKEASSSLLEDTKALLQKDPLGGTISSNNSQQKTPPRLDFNKLSQPSPTINTKEAMNLMQEMWGGTTAEKKKPEKALATVVETPKFAIFDENVAPKPASEEKPKFAIFNENAAASSEKPKFAIFDENVVASSEEKPKFAIFDENIAPPPKPMPVFQVFQDSKPTSVAKPKIQPISRDVKRLEPPKMSVVAASFIQEEEDEEEENPKTFFLPSMEDFEKLAKAASTPYSGRSFVPEEDENTCAVDLVFKKPQSIPVVAAAPKKIDIVEEQPQFQREVPLSPIMETSRENCKSSSTSSSNASQSHFTKSHWGNTQLGPQNASLGTFLPSNKSMASNKSFKPLNELTGNSGYMADSSSARTPGLFLAKKKPFVNSPSSEIQGKEKKLKMVFEKEDDEDYELTGVLDFQTDFQKFKKEAGIKTTDKASSTNQVLSVSSSRKPEHSYMQQSLVASFMEQEENLSLFGVVNKSSCSKKLDLTRPALDVSNCPNLNISNVPSPNLDLSKIPNLDISKAPNLDLTKAPSLDLSKAPNFDLSKAPSLDLSQAQSPNLDLSKVSSPHLELSRIAEISRPAMLDMTEEESLELTKPSEMAIEAEKLANLSLREELNPFDPDLHVKLLKMIGTPVQDRHGYVSLRGQKMPSFRPHSNVIVGDVEFFCMECKGEGGYGKVFKAMRCNSGNNDTIADMDAVLKVQKPARPWEFYICTEIHNRLKDDSSSWFMSIPRCYAFDDGSVFVSEHQMLSLLDVCNIVSSMKIPNVEPIAMFFTIELLHVLEQLQQANIIHGDIKPDNFLLQRRPELNKEAPNARLMFEHVKASLQVIDFGVSIDMHLFSKGQTFMHKFDKVDNRCPEMLEGKPWTYHLDYFGVASVAHTLLHGSYMKVIKHNNIYKPTGSYKRWWATQLWSDFFETFLNIEGNNFPDVVAMRLKFEEVFFEKHRKNFETAASELHKLVQ